MRDPAVEGQGRSETGTVLVVETLGAPSPARRRLRKAKARDADATTEPEVPLTRLTVIDAEPIEGDPEAWLEGLKKDEEARDARARAARACVVRAVAARRVSVADAGVADPATGSTVAVRLGYGDGDGLIEGHWTQAIEVPRDAGTRSRTEGMRTHERVAALLGGRETALVCEELLLRARSDIEGLREREAALQVRVGLEALLADRAAFGAGGQASDLAFLDERRRSTGEAANEALRGPLSAERVAEVTETLKICERVLRRRAANG